jgi:hypothetical protein
MSMSEALFCQTTAFYRSPHFRADLSRMLNVTPDHVAFWIDSLLEANSIRRSGLSASVEAVSQDAAAILVAFGIGAVGTSSITQATCQLLSMKYQCEFDLEVAIDEMGSREAVEELSKAAFGVQLAKVIEAIWRGPVRDPVALTVGWDHRGDRFGLLKYGHPKQKRSALYCSRDLFLSDNAKGVRLAGINLHLAGRLFVPCSKLRVFVELLKEYHSRGTARR